MKIIIDINELINYILTFLLSFTWSVLLIKRIRYNRKWRDYKEGYNDREKEVEDAKNFQIKIENEKLKKELKRLSKNNGLK